MPRGVIAPPKTIEEQAIIKAKFDKIGAPRLYKIIDLNQTKHKEKPGHPQKLFRHQPPEVANLAKIYLAKLMEKHKVKLESKSPKGRNGYYGILVGVATSMARKELGLGGKSWEQMRRSGLPSKTMQRIYKKALGIIVPYTPTPDNCEIREGDLTGI